MSDTSDTVLTQMAAELKAALLAKGLDPTDPPDGPAPSQKAFAEYQRRGGSHYADAEKFMVALIAAVGISS